ncbi:collagen alpha-1(XIX) chain-like isoform X2 [Sceloporus undulatus]|uniref:collagen alpha-1(XIX) chain-like isoform X2 n=1 Tax=Sceloporus undulatus TaxID=8520 RepID=UPI001C4DD739|nr:collagen alpha-1(XIX) chain-like isoform X2 [Sceloporus undulatus]
MKATRSCIIQLWLVILLFPVSYSMAVTDKTGFDLAESFSLRQISCGSGKTCFKLGNAPLIRDSQQVFPNGLPEEYFLTATFRVRRSSKKERWYLLQILDQRNLPQVYITVDGSKKIVEYIAQSTQGQSLRYTFKSHEIHSVFDRQWHKLSISVQSRMISLYVDCSLIEHRETDEKAIADFQGKILIATRYLDGKPVDIELGHMILYCNPRLAAQETCCEISEDMCLLEESSKTTTVPPSTIHVGEILALPLMEKKPEEKCFCYPNKGEAGLPGVAGLPGQKGEKGEKELKEKMAFLVSLEKREKMV